MAYPLRHSNQSYCLLVKIKLKQEIMAVHISYKYISIVARNIMLHFHSFSTYSTLMKRSKSTNVIASENFNNCNKVYLDPTLLLKKFFLWLLRLLELKASRVSGLLQITHNFKYVGSLDLYCEFFIYTFGTIKTLFDRMNAYTCICATCVFFVL